jgi:hypothetical protein
MIAATGEQAASLRRQIGDLHTHGLDYLAEDMFGTKLYDCFVTARTLPITVDTVSIVRIKIYDEKPKDFIARLVVDTAILYCLTTESIFITNMTFKNVDAVKLIMTRMKRGFDKAREQAADNMDSATYQTITALAGSLMYHLSRTALQLPRIVKFTYQASLPSLFLSQMIYQDATRSDELIDMNDIVHPLFMTLDIQGLSA